MPDTLRTYFLVALGGAIGSVARYWVSAVVLVPISRTFPWGTLVVNVTGSFVIGLLGAVLISPNYSHPAHRAWIGHFLMAGVCGGYTTFSAFSLQTLVLFNEGLFYRAAANVLFSIVLCIGAAGLGWMAGWTLSR